MNIKIMIPKISYKIALLAAYLSSCNIHIQGAAHSVVLPSTQATIATFTAQVMSLSRKQLETKLKEVGDFYNNCVSQALASADVTQEERMLEQALKDLPLLHLELLLAAIRGNSINHKEAGTLCKDMKTWIEGLKKSLEMRNIRIEEYNKEINDVLEDANSIFRALNVLRKSQDLDSWKTMARLTLPDLENCLKRLAEFKDKIPGYYEQNVQPKVTFVSNEIQKMKKKVHVQPTNCTPRATQA